MRKLFVLAAVMVVAAVVAGGASAGKPLPTLTCSSTPYGSTLSDASVGNVVVPDNAWCSLSNVQVMGNVSVGVGASFYATGGEIDGNLTASGAEFVGTGEVAGHTPIDGNVTVDSTTDTVYLDAEVGGNARFTNNNHLDLYSGVSFGGNLACSGNSHVHLDSFTVAGHASGQCAVPNLEILSVSYIDTYGGFKEYEDAQFFGPGTASYTVENTGSGPTATLTASLTGDPGFSLSSDTCAGAVLKPGDTCMFEVAYPDAIESDQSATVQITDSTYPGDAVSLEVVVPHST